MTAEIATASETIFSCSQIDTNASPISLCRNRIVTEFEEVVLRPLTRGTDRFTVKAKQTTEVFKLGH